MTTIIVTSQVLQPIEPLHKGAPITPDEVAVVTIGTDFRTVPDEEFYATPLLDGEPSVWVRGLTGGTYKVVCRMNAQGDTQRPVWELDGSILIRVRA